MLTLIAIQKQIYMHNYSSILLVKLTYCTQKLKFVNLQNACLQCSTEWDECAIKTNLNYHIFMQLFSASLFENATDAIPIFSRTFNLFKRTYSKRFGNELISY